MAEMMELSETNDEANCLIHKLQTADNKELKNRKFECRIHKNKTVRQFIHIVSQHFGLDVDSFYLVFSSYQRSSNSVAKKLDQLKLLEHDNRLLFEVGLEFGQGVINRFILYELYSERNKAVCIICNIKGSKIYPLHAKKNDTGSLFYKKVLELLECDGFNTDFFILVFIAKNEVFKYNINEDDASLLCDIGVEYRYGVINVFEVYLTKDYDKSSDNDSSMQNQEIDNEKSKINFFYNGLNLYYNKKNQSTESVISKASSCMKSNSSSKNAIPEYRGLVNQAMTCYLNSILQALYLTPEFKNSLFHWEFNFRDITKNARKSISFQLQILFLKLQTSSQSYIETTNLIRSFGWNTSEIWQQQDLQEFFRIMFEALELELKNTTHADIINRLYQGKLIDYVKCLECGIENSRVQTFFDLTLPIRSSAKSEAYQCLTDALNGYIEPELLEGVNQYDCPNCQKKCNAHKGMKFIEFPYILTVHLMRFDFDNTSMTRIKLNDKVIFPQKLDLNSFISDTNYLDKSALNEQFPEELFGPGNMCDDNNYTEEMDTSSTIYDEDENKGVDLSQHRNTNFGNSKTKSDGPYMYDLYAIMVHSGCARGGHYFAYIKDFKTNQWLCFNDKNVVKISMADIRKTYGGKTLRRSSNQSSTNAYMLMYRRIDKKKNRNAMSQEEFPKHIKALQTIIKLLNEKEKQLRKKKGSMYKVPVLLAHFIKRDLPSMEFDCDETTTLDQLKHMAIKHFKVTKPCKLVIFDTNTKLVALDLKDHMNNFINEITCLKPCTFLLQIIDDESSITPGHVLMTLFMVNLDDNEDDVDLNIPVEMEIEQHEKLGDLRDLLCLKYDLSDEAQLHFGVFLKNSSKLLIVDRNVKCSSIHTNYVFVFVQNHFMNQSILMQKVRSIITRFINTIQLQFISPSIIDIESDTEMSHQSLILDNTNSMDDHSENDDASIKSLNNLNADTVNDCNFSTESLTTNSQKLVENIDYCEDTYERENERVIDDMQMDTSTFEYDPIKTDDDLRNLEDNSSCVITDIAEDAVFTFNEKYSFKIILSDIENNGNFDAYVDKRMNVKELKNSLASHINVPIDFITLHIYKSDNTLELALPERTLKDLNDFDTIKISYELCDDQFFGTLYFFQFSKQSDGIFRKLFNWIITEGTSVLDTKKQLRAQLKKTHDIDIPLERFRLRKKKGNILMKCYLNDDIWNQNIGRNWELVIFDLLDHSEYDFDETKQLVMVFLLEDNYGSKPIIKSEFEFVVDNEIAPFSNIKLVKMISERLNVSVDDIELGYSEDFNRFMWKKKDSNWSFDLFDDNICVCCRYRQKERPLKIKINNNIEIEQ